jgi:transaldolase
VPLVKALSAEAAAGMVIEPIHYNESSFRFALNADACATEKLAEGIRAFALDTEKLEALMKAI